MMNYSLGVRSQRYLQIVDDVFEDIYGKFVSEETRISSIPSFYTTENIPLNDLHPDTVSAKRAMRGDSLCSGMVGINS